MQLAAVVRPLLATAAMASTLIAGAAYCQSGTEVTADGRPTEVPTARSQSPEPASATNEADTDDNTIVVTGRRESVTRAEVYEQARELTRVSRYQLYEEALPRFWAPICPGVAGLDVVAAGLIVDRIRANAQRAGISLAETDCSPNLVVAFVDSGQSLIMNLRRQLPPIFGRVSGDDWEDEVSRSGPVRVLSNMLWRWLGGGAPPTGWPRQRGSLRGQLDRTATPEARDIVSALVVFDRSRVQGLTLTQLADYATMRGLSHTRPASGDEPMATILALFAGGGEPPAELTTFDISYLRSLYESAPNRTAANRLLAVRGLIREEEARFAEAAPALQPTEAPPAVAQSVPPPPAPIPAAASPAAVPDLAAVREPLPDRRSDEESAALIVVGNRLRDAKMDVTLNRVTGQARCRVRRPGGDPKIDAAACDITLRCIRQHQRSRQRYSECMTAAREDFLDEYFAGWPDYR